MVSRGINKPHSEAADEWRYCFSPMIGQRLCHQPSGKYQVLRGSWTPQSNNGIKMYNISFIEYGVTDEPLEVEEAWTRTMYVCLFLGGFWCGTATFLMLLAVHTYCERFKTRQRRGPVATASPFWSDWQSSTSSHLTRGDWSSTSVEEVASWSSVSGDTEYHRAINRERDSRAIHFWRPFEDPPLSKASSCCESGE